MKKWTLSYRIAPRLCATGSLYLRLWHTRSWDVDSFNPLLRCTDTKLAHVDANLQGSIKNYTSFCICICLSHLSWTETSCRLICILRAVSYWLPFDIWNTFTKIFHPLSRRMDTEIRTRYSVFISTTSMPAIWTLFSGCNFD